MANIEIILQSIQGYFLILLFLSFSVQIYFYFFVFRKVVIYKNHNPQIKKHAPPPISVIIAAKDEEKNLRKNLQKVLNQDYTTFEVIVVNDGSTDNSEQYLNDLQKLHTNLRIVTIENSTGKKNALSIGIEQSKNNHLLFTDADCYPVSSNWISTIATYFTEGKQIVLAHGSYEKRSSILNNFICFDSFFISIQYFGAAIIGQPYMGVGRNLAYTKSIWQQNNGFSSHKHLISGDDDLFIISAATNTNTAICLNPAATTISETKNTLKEFIKQKSRHVSTSKKYNITELFLSGGELLSRFIFYVSLIVLFFSNYFALSLALLLIKQIFAIVILRKYSKKINEHYKFYYYIIFDIFAPLIYILIWIFFILRIKNYYSNATKE
jgi:poly-beta-1,6-N-acetyl-D-glucosamine synthase